MSPSANGARHASWLVLALLAGGAPLASCQSAPEGSATSAKTPESKPSPALDASTGSQAALEGFRGLVVTRESTPIEAAYEARLEEVTVALGDRVRRGMVLARLDMVPIQSDLKTARASLGAAEAERRKVEVALRDARDRRERLDALGDIVSRQEHDSAEAAERMLEADLAARDARVAEATALVEKLSDRLARAEIKAPVDGTVSAVLVTPGTTIRPGITIATLVDAQDVVVRFAVPRGRAQEVWPGLDVRFRLEDSDQDLAGTVVQVSPEVDLASEMLLCIARLDLFPGLQEPPPSGAIGRIYAADVTRRRAD